MQVIICPDGRTGTLENKVRKSLKKHDFEARNMFGGTTFTLLGNMLCSVSSKGLMVRIDPQLEFVALARPHAAPCLGAGRRMAGFVMVGHEGLTTQSDVPSWLGLALRYVEPMPSREKKVKYGKNGDHHA